MAISSIIVLSDLHVSAGPLDDFDAELEKHFVTFLAGLGQRGEPVELVINGDFLDFVQADPWEGAPLSSVSKAGWFNLCFTQEQSLTKLKTIHAAHGELFAALSQFLAAHAGNRLVILPGNHDADFFFEDVCCRFKEWVGVPERICIHRAQPYYRPADAANVLIEHGHQYDFCNSFGVLGQARWTDKHPPILPGKDGVDRLIECIGTRFLLRYLNRLDRDYHYVDNVKPFSRFLSIFGRSALVPGYGPTKAAVAVWDMIRYVAETLGTQPSDLLGIEGAEAGPRAVLLHRLRALGSGGRLQFQDLLKQHGFALEVPVDMFLQQPANAERLFDFLAEHLDLLDALPESPSHLGLGAAAGQLSLVPGFAFDETKALTEAAKSRLKDKTLDTIIMGHTHEVVKRDDLRYFNTGCWTRYYRFQPNEPVCSWDLLREPEYGKFPYELNYVEITPGRPAVAQFHTFEKYPR